MKKILLLSLFLCSVLFAAGYTKPKSVDVPGGNAEWLRLDGTNGPMTGNLDFGIRDLFNVKSLEIDNGVITPTLVSPFTAVYGGTPVHGISITRPTGAFPATGLTIFQEDGFGLWKIRSASDLDFVGASGNLGMRIQTSNINILFQTQFLNQASPTASSASYHKFYPKADGRFYQRNSASVEEKFSIDSLVMLLSGANAMTGSMNLGNQNINAAKDITMVGVFDHAGTIGLNGAVPVAQSAAIANAAGGTIIDVEARAALNALLAYLRTRGDIAP